MSKELPYFKFEPNQWENGNIQICSNEEKGVYIDLCSMYWSRLGDVPYKLAVRKICGGNATAIDSLYEEKIIDIQDGLICINFLNEQLLEFENTSNQNSKNAKEGWAKRNKIKELAKNKGDKDATAMRPQSESDAIREDKRRLDKSKEDKIKENSLPIEKIGGTSIATIKNEEFENFWNFYDKKVSKMKTLKKWVKLSKEDIKGIKATLRDYIKSTPDKNFRKDPLTYLNNESWNDEIINFKENSKQPKEGELTAEGLRNEWINLKNKQS